MNPSNKPIEPIDVLQKMPDKVDLLLMYIENAEKAAMENAGAPSSSASAPVPSPSPLESRIDSLATAATSVSGREEEPHSSADDTPSLFSSLAKLFRGQTSSVQKLERENKSIEEAETALADYPWSVIPRFANLLIRTLRLEYSKVFLTEYFRLMQYSLARDGPQISFQKVENEPLPVLRFYEDRIEHYLRYDDCMLGVLVVCLNQVNWLVEKAYVTLRESVGEDWCLFDVLANDEACTQFVELCRLIQLDTVAHCGEKYLRPNVMQAVEEGDKVQCLAFFRKAVSSPFSLANNFSKERLPYVRNKANEKVIEHLRRVVNEADKGANEDVMFPNIARLLLWNLTCVSPKRSSLLHDCYGYFLRLTLQACGVGRIIGGTMKKSSQFTITEEIYFGKHHITNGYAEAYINDFLGPNAQAARKAVFAIREVMGIVDDAFTFMKMLGWLLGDRSRLVHCVELISLIRNIDRAKERTNASLSDALFRRMMQTHRRILGWFAELSERPSL